MRPKWGMDSCRSAPRNTQTGSARVKVWIEVEEYHPVIRFIKTTYLAEGLVQKQKGLPFCLCGPDTDGKYPLRPL